jgi:hypothetical protein
MENMESERLSPFKHFETSSARLSDGQCPIYARPILALGGLWGFVSTPK